MATQIFIGLSGYFVQVSTIHFSVKKNILHVQKGFFPIHNQHLQNLEHNFSVDK